VLIIGGATSAEIGSGVELVAGIVGAVALFIAFVAGKIKKE
jgi:hypothetical protein